MPQWPLRKSKTRRQREIEKTIKARGDKNGPLQAGQRKARFRRAFVFSFQMSLVSRSILIGVSLSAAARSAAALVKDKLTPNCHFVVLRTILQALKKRLSIAWIEAFRSIYLFDRMCALGRRPRAKRAGDGTAAAVP